MTVQKERLSQLRRERELEEFEKEHKVIKNSFVTHNEVVNSDPFRGIMFVFIRPLIPSKISSIPD